MTKKLKIFLAIWLSSISGLYAQSRPMNSATIPYNSRQVIIVVNSQWTDFHAVLIAFERKGNKWKQQFSFDVVLGAAGLGWGKGVWSQEDSADIRKREGDKRSPAGLFSLGKAFGYFPASESPWLKWPYIEARDTLFCVDDAHSAYYNSLVSADSVKQDWNSFEYMHRKDDAYKWGIFVNHNPYSLAGAGSCIFLHIWSGKDVPTVGCTAMPEERIIQLLHWLDVSAMPLLIQLPKNEYLKLSNAHPEWNWPRI